MCVSLEELQLEEGNIPLSLTVVLIRPELC